MRTEKTALPLGFFTGDKMNELNELEMKKRLLLATLQTSHRKNGKYRRLSLSPIRYAGGKSVAVGYIVELLPTNIKRVISPFFGGGSVEIAINKYLGLEVIGFDIFDILVNYWKFQIDRPMDLYHELRKLTPNKKTFDRVRSVLKDHWEGKITLEPLKLAAYFFFNFNLSYGPGFLGWTSNIYLDGRRYERMLKRVRDFNVEHLRVECADFRDVLKKYPNDFMYLDPPYYIGPDSKMFGGIYPHRNFPIHHKDFPHEDLRDLLKEHRGGFILSYNDCPTIRKWYSEYEMSFPKWQYTMGQGETRIGKNRIEKGLNHVKNSHEVLIYSYPKV